MVGRKNGKTLMAAVVGYYCLLLDRRARRAGDLLRQLPRSGGDPRSSVPLRKYGNARPRSAAGVGCTKGNLYVERSASFWRPLADSARRWDRPQCPSRPVRRDPTSTTAEPYRAGVESSMGSRRQPLMLAITTAGFDQAGFGGQLYDYMREVGVDPKSPIENDEAFSYIAQLDPEDDPDDERNWPKANPNLGISKKLEYLRGEWKKSKGNALGAGELPREGAERLDVADRAVARSRRLGRLRRAGTPPRPCAAPVRSPVSISRAPTDLTALVLVFRELDPMPVLPFFLAPGREPPRSHEPGSGALRRLGRPGPDRADRRGNVVDYDFIERRVIELSTLYQISEIAYDPHNALQIRDPSRGARLPAGPHRSDPRRPSRSLPPPRDASDGAAGSPRRPSRPALERRQRPP